MKPVFAQKMGYGALLLGLLVLASGCVADSEQDLASSQDIGQTTPGQGGKADDAEANSEKLLAGATTYDRPEIGRIRGCTATLVAPNVIISAAHCVDYQSREATGDYGRFTVDLGPRQERSFVIERFKSYDRQLGRNDVVLMRLAQAVPPSVAIPTGISTRGANPGEPVTVYGYGCTDRSTQRGGFIKRKYDYSFGRSSVLCPGDSGGPVVLGADGPVFLINSGYFTGSGTDIFGEPYLFARTLEDQMDTWDELYGAPVTPEAVSVTNSTGSILWVRCDGNNSSTCSDWTLLQNGESTAVLTSGRRLIIDNQRSLPGVDFSFRRVTAPSASVTVYPNVDDPFEPTSQPEDPEDDDTPDNPGPDLSCLGGTGINDALPLDGPIQGRVCSGQDAWVSFEAFEGQDIAVVVTFEHSDGDIDTGLYNASNRQIARSNGVGDAEQMNITAPEDGTYFVRIYGYNGAANNVSVDVQLDGRSIMEELPEEIGGDDEEEDDQPQGCREEPDEPNGAFSQAGQLTPGTFPGGLCESGDNDIYFVNIDGPWFITVNFTNTDGDLDIELYNTDNRRIGSSNGVTDAETLQGNGPGFVRVYGYNGATNGYSITLNQ